MWTEEKLKEEAEKWCAKHCLGIIFPAQLQAFLAGCKYIINNTQKDGKTD